MTDGFGIQTIGIVNVTLELTIVNGGRMSTKWHNCSTFGSGKYPVAAILSIVVEQYCFHLSFNHPYNCIIELGYIREISKGSRFKVSFPINLDHWESGLLMFRCVVYE